MWTWLGPGGPAREGLAHKDGTDEAITAGIGAASGCDNSVPGRSTAPSSWTSHAASQPRRQSHKKLL